MDNPFINPLFAPAIERVAAIIAVLLLAGLVSFVMARKKGRPTKLLVKALSVAWIAPLLVISLFIGGLLFATILTLIMLQAVREFCEIAEVDRDQSVALAALSVVGIALVLVFGTVKLLLLLPPIAFLVFGSLPIVRGRPAGGFEQVARSTIGYLWIGFPFAVFAFSRSEGPDGLAFWLVAGTAIALADAGGFFVGKLVGGPKLASKISPNKTWSGAAGSVAAASVGVLVQWYAIPTSWSLTRISALTIIVAAGAIYGDLLESAVKRSLERKDAGNVIAGFGGVLDRFDSYLVAIPVAYFILPT